MALTSSPLVYSKQLYLIRVADSNGMIHSLAYLVRLSDAFFWHKTKISPTTGSCGH